MTTRILMFFAAILFISNVFATESDETTEARIAQTVVRILFEQPNTIEVLTENRVYLDPERISITREGVFATYEDSIIEIPSFAIDGHGVYLLCRSSQVSAEAQKYYDRSNRAFWEAVFHAASAGAAIRIPPIAIYEGVKAVEHFKEFSRERLEGLRP